MARIRTIKPEFFTSEDIVSLSPLARLLFIATWCEADKEGRLVWKPITFKLRYFPGDNCDIQAMCNEIIDAGLVKLYGEGFAVIPTFKAHQHINPRESDSNLPEPVAITTRKERVGTRQAPDSDAQGGREGKGKEGNEQGTDAPFVLPEWIPEDTWAAYRQVRTGKKAKNEPHALGLIVKDLEKFKAAGHDPVEILNNSIKSGWAGVFEPKGRAAVIGVTVPSSKTQDPALQKIVNDQQLATRMPDSIRDFAKQIRVNA